MRKPIIVGNWKMNKLNSEALEFMQGIEAHLTGNEKADEVPDSWKKILSALFNK